MCDEFTKSGIENEKKCRCHWIGSHWISPRVDPHSSSFLSLFPFTSAEFRFRSISGNMENNKNTNNNMYDEMIVSIICKL